MPEVFWSVSLLTWHFLLWGHSKICAITWFHSRCLCHVLKTIMFCCICHRNIEIQGINIAVLKLQMQLMIPLSQLYLNSKTICTLLVCVWFYIIHLIFFFSWRIVEAEFLRAWGSYHSPFFSQKAISSDFKMHYLKWELETLFFHKTTNWSSYG